MRWALDLGFRCALAGSPLLCPLGRGRLVDYGAALEMRFGATHRGFESRPLRHPLGLVGWLSGILAALALVAACSAGRPAFGPIPDEATAIRASMGFTDLAEPVTVLRVEQGPAGQLVWTPGGMYPDEETADRERAKRQRPAWGVTLSGLYPTQCHDQDPCPMVETQQQMAIDAETGELLLSIIGGEIEPGVNDDVACPGDPRCPPG